MYYYFIIQSREEKAENITVLIINIVGKFRFKT